MTEYDLRRVLTDHVADVYLPDDARRKIRLAAKEEPQVKKKLSMTLVLTLVLVMLSSVALAASLGMFDFLEARMGTKVLPGAASVTDVAIMETDLVTFTIREAAFDGFGASVMVEVTPRSDKYFLLCEGGYMADDPVAGLLRDESLGEMTIAEYAKAHGYEDLIEVNGQFAGADGIWVVDEWENNVITLVYSFGVEGKEANLTFEGLALPRLADGSLDWDRACQAETTFTLTASPVLWTKEIVPAQDIPAAGFIIDSVSLKGTTLATYMDVNIIVTDIVLYSQYANLSAVDENGNTFRPGATYSASSPRATENDQHVTAYLAISPMTQSPDTLYFTLWNYETGEDISITVPTNE